MKPHHRKRNGDNTSTDQSNNVKAVLTMGCARIGRRRVASVLRGEVVIGLCRLCSHLDTSALLEIMSCVCIFTYN